MPLGNLHLSSWSEMMMMRGSRWVKPQWRPATSGITGLDSAAVNQGLQPQAKQAHIQHTQHILTVLKQLKWNCQPCQDDSRRLISNASSWNPAGHTKDADSPIRVQRWLYGNENTHIKFIIYLISCDSTSLCYFVPLFYHFCCFVKTPRHEIVPYNWKNMAEFSVTTHWFQRVWLNNSDKTLKSYFL